MYQRQTQVIRQVGVLEAAFVLAAVGEQGNAGQVVGGGQGGQLQAQPLVETGDAMDMAFAVDAGEHPRHHRAVFQYVSRPAGGLGAIRQHAHGAVGPAHHVNRVQN